jgi:hypothetical protein
VISKSLRIFAALAIVLFVVPVPAAFAQSGSLRGSVRDETGAVLPGVISQHSAQGKANQYYPKISPQLESVVFDRLTRIPRAGSVILRTRGRF